MIYLHLMAAGNRELATWSASNKNAEPSGINEPQWFLFLVISHNNFPYLKERNFDMYDSEISNFEAQIVYKFHNI